MRKIWTLVLLATVVLLAVALPGSDGDDKERTAYGYDGSVYSFYYHLDKTEYYSEMVNFEAGADKVQRVPYDLEGYPLKEIADQAFSGSSGITTVVIPAGVAKLGSKVFDGCSSLTEVIFLGAMPTMASDAFTGSSVTVKYLDRFASSWSGFSQTTKSVLPVYTYSVTDCSFEYYELDGSITVLRHISGTTIKIPSELEAGSSKLKVKFIGDMAFYYDYYNAECTQDKVKSVEIAEGVEIIRTAAFKYCSYMETLSLPSTLKIIDDEAFRMPIDLQEWSTGSLKEVKLPNGLEYMGFECFRMSNQLKTVTVPDSVTYYGEGVFRASARLESVTLGKGITELPLNSFDNCYKLKEVIIPDTVTSIGNQCFNQDIALETIVLPNTVTEIGSGAFSNCSALYQVSMPDGVKIGDGCFSSSAMQTLIITSASKGSESVIAKYFDEGDWALPGMTKTHIQLLVLDTEDKISADISGVSGHIKITQKTVNTTGGTYIDGSTTVTGADRAGKTYSNTAGSWTSEKAGTVVFIGDSRYGTLDTNGGTYPEGATITVNATPKTLCVFQSWSDGDTNPHKTVTVKGDQRFYANFVYSPVSLELKVNPEGSGTVQGAGKYAGGSNVTISATPSEGYHFISWSNGMTDSRTVITVTEDTSLEASFGNVEITFDLNGGKMKIDPMYSNSGWKITLPSSVETLDGKSITAWEIGGQSYSVGSEYKVTGNVTAKAVWGIPNGGTDFTIIIVAVIAVIAIAAVAFFVYRRKQFSKQI